jgi:3',5'-cyclic AMP phosphodiesterase CpdA
VTRSFRGISGRALHVLLAATAALLALGASPDGGPAPALRFAVYGDTRDGHDVHAAIVAGALAKGAELVLETGDLVRDSSSAAEWARFDAITAVMRAAIPFYPARGNHDNQGGDMFAARLPRTGVSRERFHYSFDRGPVHFVVIDTEEALGPGTPQYAWLDADLERARRGGRSIVAIFHKPVFSIGADATRRDVTERREALHPLFRRHGVVLAFSGHDHMYYRTIRDGVAYVVTGGGGAPLYRAAHAELRAVGDVFESAHHFCVAEVRAGALLVTVYRQDLSELDRFTVGP